MFSPWRSARGLLRRPSSLWRCCCSGRTPPARSGRRRARPTRSTDCSGPGAPWNAGRGPRNCKTEKRNEIKAILLIFSWRNRRKQQCWAIDGPTQCGRVPQSFHFYFFKLSRHKLPGAHNIFGPGFWVVTNSCLFSWPLVLNAAPLTLQLSAVGAGMCLAAVPVNLESSLYVRSHQNFWAKTTAKTESRWTNGSCTHYVGQEEG